MDRLIYTAMTGAKGTMDQQAAVAHNLANATSTGFRAEPTSCARWRCRPTQCAHARSPTPASRTTSTRARCSAPAAPMTWRCRARAGLRCRCPTAGRGLYPQRQPRRQRQRHPADLPMASRCWATAGRSPSCPTTRSASAPTARSPLQPDQPGAVNVVAHCWSIRPRPTSCGDDGLFRVRGGAGAGRPQRTCGRRLSRRQQR